MPSRLRLMILIGVTSIVLVGFYALRLKLANDLRKNELRINNSDKFTLDQNNITRNVVVKAGNAVLVEFKFTPTIFAAWIDRNNRIFMVTTDTGSITGAQGLYINDGKQIKKVYQARNVEFANGEKSPGRLYISYFSRTSKNIPAELDRLKSIARKSFQLSPNHKLLFGYESGYEGGAGFGVNLESLDTIKDPPNGNKLWWSPTGECAVNMAFYYGPESNLELFHTSSGSWEKLASGETLLDSEILSVDWENGCEGNVLFRHEVEGNNYSYKIIEDRVSISKSGFKPANKTKTDSKPSLESDQLESIFFTVEKATDK